MAGVGPRLSLFGISRATIELDIGDETYLCSSEHVPGVGTIVVMQDITYVKELEAVRSELMHTITHDLKSPLTSIIGFAHILERTATLEERSHHFLEQINIAATRILDMIGQLMRTVDDSTTLGREMAPLDLNALVRELIADVEGAAAANSCRPVEERGSRLDSRRQAAPSCASTCWTISSSRRPAPP